MYNSTLSDLFIYLILLSVGFYVLIIRVFEIAGDKDARDLHERIDQPGEIPDDDPRDRRRRFG